MFYLIFQFRNTYNTNPFSRLVFREFQIDNGNYYRNNNRNYKVSLTFGISIGTVYCKVFF